MSHFFFLLKIILFTSCATSRLPIDRNSKTKKPIPETHMDRLLKNSLYLVKDEVLTECSDKKLYKYYLKFLEEIYHKPGSGLGTISLPYSLEHKNGNYFAVTPLTTVEHYPENLKKDFIDSGVSLVLLNCYAYIGFTPLLDYLDYLDNKHYKPQTTAWSCTFARIEQIVENAKKALESGKPIGDIVFNAFERISKYQGKQLKKSCIEGYLENNQYIQQQTGGQFCKLSKQVQANIVKGVGVDLAIKKVLYDDKSDKYKPYQLFIIYAQHVYKKLLTKLDITGKSFDIHEKRGVRAAAEFYFEAIKILEQTAEKTHEDIEKAINTAFEDAKKVPEETIDEILVGIEGTGKKEKKNDRTKKQTKSRGMCSTQIKKNSKEKSQNISFKKR